MGKTRKAKSGRRFQYESLEDRRLMAVTGNLNNGVLTVTGTSGNDDMRFLQSGGWFGLQNGTIGWFSAASVHSVVVNLNGGDDSVSLTSTTNGGGEALSSTYTVNSGVGNETVHLQNGNDVAFSGAGHQLITGSTGTPTLDGQAVSTTPKVTATLNNGVLTVTGTSGNDDMRFLQSGGWFGLQNGTIGWFSASSVHSVVINLGGGDDKVSFDSLANGGGEALGATFTVNSGAGNKTVHLASGSDVTFSGSGHQLVAPSTGTVTLDGQAVNAPQRVTASLSNGVLTVTGTSGDDTLLFLQSAGWFGLQNGTIGWFSAASVTSVVINLGDGNDTVSFTSTSNGGSEALSATFTVNSGLGSKTVHLANGHDATFSGAGHRLVANSAGAVTLDGQVLYAGNPAPPSTNWFDSHVSDAALRALGHNLFLDNLVDRNDMISLLRSAEDGNVIDSTEFNDLKAIVANTALFGTLDFVDQLAADVVTGNAANAHYQGATLNNLAANSSSGQMENLINKWFLGLDRPTAGGAYQQTAGQLFVNGVAYTDINQGYVGDCYFVSTLAETALKNPSIITNMFIGNGDGTYTVRFFNNGKAQYVTVDSYLPTDGSGRLIYASVGSMYNNSGNELWVGLAEKAYAQLNEIGFVRPGLPGNGQNAYSAIESGYIYAAQSQITGLATTAFTTTGTTAGFQAFVTAYNAGKEIGFASKTTPSSSSVVGSHAYAVVGYNSANQTITLYNPWGIQYGLVTMTWAQIQANFSYFDRTA